MLGLVKTTLVFLAHESLSLEAPGETHKTLYYKPAQTSLLTVAV